MVEECSIDVISPFNPHLLRIKEKAAELNAESDTLNLRIKEVEDALRDANIGFSFFGRSELSSIGSRGKDKHIVRLGWCPCDVGGGKLDWCLAVAFQSVDAETYYECFDTGSDAIVNPNLADYYVHILSKTSREVRLRAFKSLDLFLSEFTNAITSTIEDITCKFKF